MAEIGLIVEGLYDVEVLKRLAERINAGPVNVIPIPCNGPVTKKFAKLLYVYEYMTPVQKVLVISDAHGRDPAAIIESLRAELRGREFTFPIEFAVVVQELEAWLLADNEAIHLVCTQRGKQKLVPPTKSSPELFADAKTELRKLLVERGIDYTATVAQQIAHNARLEQIRYWCQSFRTFEPIATVNAA